MSKETLKLGGKFDVFVFDWDGTLNSLKWIRAVNEKINPSWWYKKKRSASASGKTAQGAYGSDNELLKDLKRFVITPLVDLYLFFDKPRLQNGAKGALDDLRARGKKVAIFTNAAKYRVDREVKSLKVEDYFAVIVSAQDLKVLKPNPLGLETVIKGVRAHKKTVLYIGDMTDDIKMAKRYSKEIAEAKVKSCGIASGLDSYDTLKSESPDYLFRSMEEFRKAL